MKRLHEPSSLLADHDAVRSILQRLGLDELIPHEASDRIDRVVLHPVVGPLLLAALLFLMFQAVFAWAEVPMEWIEAATAWLAAGVGTLLPAGWVSSLLVDGVIAGAGGVLVFLPQIVILFFFILLLEESGYLPRAAFLLDRLMGAVGLSGRSFIPLLSSYACAVPGIMAARTIADPRDRLVTIMIAPLMTCSARLPVYTLLIGAFIPQRVLGGWIELQGLVLFSLYAAGILGAMLVAWVLKRFTAAGRHVRPLMMELPQYHLPVPAQHCAGALAARRHLRAARRHDHPVADCADVVPRELPHAAAGRDRRAHPSQFRGDARPGSGRVVRADRIQLADQRRAGAGSGGARSGGQRARDGLFAVGQRHRHRRSPWHR